MRGFLISIAATLSVPFAAGYVGAQAGSVVDLVIAHQFAEIKGDQQTRAELMGIVRAFEDATETAHYPRCQLNDAERATAHVTKNDWAQFFDYVAQDYAGVNVRAVAAARRTASYAQTFKMIDLQRQHCDNKQVRNLIVNLFTLLSERSTPLSTEAMRLSTDTRTYARWLDRWAPPNEILIRALSGERYKATPEQQRAKMDELWVRDVKYFGEPRIFELAERIRTAPKTDADHITPAETQALGCQSQDAPRCFWELLTKKK